MYGLVLSLPAIAQSGFDDPEDSRPYNFSFTHITRLKPCDTMGKFKNEPYVESPDGGRVFTIAYDSPSADSVVIYMWDFDATSQSTEAALYNDKYFLMSRNDVANNARRRYSTALAFTAGSTLVPVKVRFRPFDFSKDITLGPAIGWKGRMGHHSKNYFDLLFGFGITSVSLTSASTNGVINDDSDRPALTPSLGVVFEMDITQFGFFVGQDYVSNRNLNNWQYHGDIWFSAGLGFTILSRSAKLEPEKQKQQ
ncbi:hypothetical protein SAMN04515668_2496 [Hymenobacter arizonensis]|uniref:Uncharacterized protein n=2 Tax=Hymenobacter arizonensis TaxID=1227077 RepID=A0A1I5YW75_HYMAR|nr:hypothetical protein SAMN04515668_2496 [Hymenobacter arizonensis]